MDGLLNKSILVVDDDERMLRALAKTLSSEGAMVITSQWGGDAIEILSRREQKVDLVLTDLRMPLVTGAALVHSIHLIFPELPIVVLTAFGSHEARAECLRQGAAAFLEKNLSTAQLLAAIEEVFTSRKPVDERPSSTPAWKEVTTDGQTKAESSGD